MPELPEVETVKRGISALIGQTITQFMVRNPNLRYKISSSIEAKLVGNQIANITRRAKYLIITLKNDSNSLKNKGFLIIHLGMSGSLKLLNAATNIPIQKHDHVDLYCTNNILRYNDPRRFGTVMHIDNLEDCFLLKDLGPEPLEKEFSATYLLQKLKNRKSTLKQLIMNNSIVVGVGNIYACEALFLAKISPLRLGYTITKAEADTLVTAIKQVLGQAIELGGSSLRDYKQADGNLGYFQNIHNVYAKAGQECKICKSIILEVRLGQRNSFYCSYCQK